jgi:Fur family transcriptional regulator, ferric uptake regulator
LHLQLTATIAHVGQTAEQALNVDVISALRERGLRMTPQRRAIVAEIMRTQGHISPTALARKVQGDMPGVNASTIYRTLALLEEMGVLAHAHLESGAEYHRTEEAGHVHLTCSNCGDEDDLSIGEADALIRLIEQHHGFERDRRPVRRLQEGERRRGLSPTRRTTRAARRPSRAGTRSR